MDNDDSLRRVLLEMKAKTGRLTDAERDELLRMPRFVGGEDGGGVLVVGARLTQEQFLEKFGGATLPTTPEGWAARWREMLGDDAAVPDVFHADS